jgi:MinD-like ATPase involved in chromosome partitioning or flagellar assembly
MKGLCMVTYRSAGDEGDLERAPAGSSHPDRLPTALGARIPPVLGEPLTFEVDLPVPVHESPEHERAVELMEPAADPSLVGVSTGPTTTTTITIAEPALVATSTPPSAEEPGPVVAAEYSRRERMAGTDVGPESSQMLTADRLIDPKFAPRQPPEGAWRKAVYLATFRTINLGDSPRARQRKLIDARIGAALEGGARFIPVLTRKGGVGKTTITTLLGMALASVREDRIIAIDANPDRGTLSERVAKQTRATVRDVVNRGASIQGFNDFSKLVSRDSTRLDILASDTDPMLSEAFDENDYNVVADLASRYYSIVLTDCGTGIVHSVMRATLQRADSIVIVSGGSVDEARLASETLTWLEANDYGDLVRNAVVAINTATQGTNLVKLEEIEAHFASRVRAIVRIPYDDQLAAGSVINWSELRPLTRQSARELAAIVIDGMPERLEL